MITRFQPAWCALPQLPRYPLERIESKRLAFTEGHSENLFKGFIWLILNIMKKDRAHCYRWLLSLAVLCALPAVATTVYKTVDENGVVSFSDARPQGESPVETVVIDAQQSQLSPEEQQQRLEDMRETTDRMAADRMAREKHRAEMRQLQAQRAPQEPQSSYPQYYEPRVIYSGYSSYRNRRPGWNHRPRPGHPIARPPYRPPGHSRPPTVRPIQYNNYPASLVRKSYNPRVRAAVEGR